MSTEDGHLASKEAAPMEPESFEQEAAEHSEGGMLTALGNLRALRIYFRPPTNLLD